MSQITNEQVTELVTNLQFFDGDAEFFCDEMFSKLHKKANEIREELFMFYTSTTIEHGKQFNFSNKKAKRLWKKLTKVNKKIELLRRVLEYAD